VCLILTHARLKKGGREEVVFDPEVDLSPAERQTPTSQFERSVRNIT